MVPGFKAYLRVKVEKVFPRYQTLSQQEDRIPVPIRQSDREGEQLFRVEQLSKCRLETGEDREVLEGIASIPLLPSSGTSL